jgi:hypothetical protein
MLLWVLLATKGRVIRPRPSFHPVDKGALLIGYSPNALEKPSEKARARANRHTIACVIGA